MCFVFIGMCGIAIRDTKTNQTPNTLPKKTQITLSSVLFYFFPFFSLFFLTQRIMRLKFSVLTVFFIAILFQLASGFGEGFALRKMVRAICEVNPSENKGSFGLCCRENQNGNTITESTFNSLCFGEVGLDTHNRIVSLFVVPCFLHC